MKKIFIPSLLLLLASCIILTSCLGDDDNQSECQAVACTEDFITISVIIKDENDNPVALDAFEVIVIENSQDITISSSEFSFENAQQLGIYPLVNDSSLDVNQVREIQFKGFIDNQEVIQSTYTVETDCCHIGLNIGNIELFL